LYIVHRLNMHELICIMANISFIQSNRLVFVHFYFFLHLIYSISVRFHQFLDVLIHCEKLSIYESNFSTTRRRSLANIRILSLLDFYQIYQILGCFIQWYHQFLRKSNALIILFRWVTSYQKRNKQPGCLYKKFYYIL